MKCRVLIVFLSPGIILVSVSPPPLNGLTNTGRTRTSNIIQLQGMEIMPSRILKRSKIRHKHKKSYCRGELRVSSLSKNTYSRINLILSCVIFLKVYHMFHEIKIPYKIYNNKSAHTYINIP